MDSIDNRRRAFEDKFAHDEGLRFRALVQALRHVAADYGLDDATTQSLIHDTLMTKGQDGTIAALAQHANRSPHETEGALLEALAQVAKTTKPD
jgi:hypothetical protein